MDRWNPRRPKYLLAGPKEEPRFCPGGRDAVMSSSPRRRTASRMFAEPSRVKRTSNQSADGREDPAPVHQAFIQACELRGVRPKDAAQRMAELVGRGWDQV